VLWRCWLEGHLLCKQEAQLLPRGRAMRRVNWNLANCHATVLQKLLIRSGVLLKLEVGIRKRAWQRAWRYPAIYDHWGEYTLSKKPRKLVYAIYPRIPPNTPLLIRQVLTKSMVWSWRFSRMQCVIDNVHSTMMWWVGCHCLKCHKQTDDVELCISPVYRRLAVAKSSKSTM